MRYLGIRFMQVLYEVDESGNLLAEKECRSCKAGSVVLASPKATAGVTFSADPYTCQTCPDPNMAFDDDGECECQPGYTKVKSSPGLKRRKRLQNRAYSHLQHPLYAVVMPSRLEWSRLGRSLAYLPPNQQSFRGICRRLAWHIG